MDGKTPVVVNAEWAAAHLDDPAVRFVEVDVDTAAYLRGHIPGAVAWDWTRDLCDRVRRDVIDRAALAALLARSGVGPDTFLVLYGDNNNWFAAWAYWQLKLFGVDRVALLDGGRRYWLDSGLPFTTDVPVLAEAATTATAPLAEPAFATRAFRDDVAAAVRSPGSVVLVDVRSPAEYSGEIVAPPGTKELAQRAGHIPGAVSVPWSRAIQEDGRFRARDELAAMFEAAGVTADREIVTYCRIGERSSHTWFVLHELLGFPNVRNYDGSWSEWGSMVAMPIEKGSAAAAQVSGA